MFQTQSSIVLPFILFSAPVPPQLQHLGTSFNQWKLALQKVLIDWLTDWWIPSIHPSIHAFMHSFHSIRFTSFHFMSFHSVSFHFIHRSSTVERENRQQIYNSMGHPHFLPSSSLLIGTLKRVPCSGKRQYTISPKLRCATWGQVDPPLETSPALRAWKACLSDANGASAITLHLEPLLRFQCKGIRWRYRKKSPEELMHAQLRPQKDASIGVLLKPSSLPAMGPPWPCLCLGKVPATLQATFGPFGGRFSALPAKMVPGTTR